MVWFMAALAVVDSAWWLMFLGLGALTACRVSEERLPVRTKLVLTDEDVRKMAAAAEAHAVANQWNVTVTIFDDGGHLLYLHRMDGVAASTVEMAIGKGRTALLGRRETKIYEDIIKQGTHRVSERAAGRDGRRRSADRREG